jgi:hypothetical protein
LPKAGLIRLREDKFPLYYVVVPAHLLFLVLRTKARIGKLVARKGLYKIKLTVESEEGGQ